MTRMLLAVIALEDLAAGLWRWLTEPYDLITLDIDRKRVLTVRWTRAGTIGVGAAVLWWLA